MHKKKIRPAVNLFKAKEKALLYAEAMRRMPSLEDSEIQQRLHRITVQMGKEFSEHGNVTYPTWKKFEEVGKEILQLYSHGSPKRSAVTSVEIPED